VESESLMKSPDCVLITVKCFLVSVWEHTTFYAHAILRGLIEAFAREHSVAGILRGVAPGDW
jgi:hypothetical protein